MDDFHVDFDARAFELCDPDETVVMTARAGAASDYIPGDPRIIPVELETSFAFDESGEVIAVSSDLDLLPPPEVVLLDAGDLDLVDDILAGLGVESERIQVEHYDELGEWPRPTRLLVASGRLALGLSMASEHGAPDFSALAVSDEGSRGFARHMRELGFQYVVNQPVHPEVLRLLLQQALFRGNQQRRALRYPVGRQVAWRRGRQRQHATLVELSSLGGHVYSRNPAAVDAPISLRVRGSKGDCPLVLRGRVVRCERRPGDDRRFSLGVAWDCPTESERQTLDRLLGSPGARRRAEVAAAVAAATARQPETPRNAPPRRAPSTRPPRRPSELLLPNRRCDRRSKFQREIVALDTGNRVCSTLVGRDLSPQGIRVERHEALAAGLQLRVAVHTERGEEPLVVETQVSRDDGTRGLLLRFCQVDETLAAQISYMLARLPSLEATRRRPRSTRSAA
jgi:hypothetical protein